MVKLRLTRLGKNKQPFYRIVAADVKTGQQGSALGLVGTYDPLHARVAINEEAALNWLNRGAQMTGTVEALFRSQGLLARWQGIEGKVRPDALSKDKPARRRKLAATKGGDQQAPEAAPAAQE